MNVGPLDYSALVAALLPSLSTDVYRGQRAMTPDQLMRTLKDMRHESATVHALWEVWRKNGGRLDYLEWCAMAIIALARENIDYRKSMADARSRRVPPLVISHDRPKATRNKS